MPKHIPYPEIAQFRNAIHQVTNKARQTGVDANGDPVYDHAKTLPVLTYEGTVKLHGTNAAIGLDRTTGELWFQSRENVITLEKDNAGFVRHFNEIDKLAKGGPTPLKAWLSTVVSDAKVVVVFGEWCGGNVQPNVALANLPKRFVVFGVKADDVWMNRSYVALVKNELLGIENIYDFYTERIDIDFSFPQLVQNILADLTVKVEAECPFAKAHGVSGVGEGIVWKCLNFGWEDPMFYFKVKGEKHSVTKVKKLAAVDIEKVNSFREFAEKTVTENRCRQGVDKLREAGKKTDRTSLGDFLKWVQADVEKEESDTAKASGLDLKAASGEITKAARTWFFKNETSF
jgi:hypothetical protein